MSEDKVKILGVAGPRGDRQEMEVPKMRPQQEIWDELFRIGQTRSYEMPEMIREVLRQRVIALNWVLNLLLKVDSDHVKTLTLTEKEVEMLETLMR